MSESIDKKRKKAIEEWHREEAEKWVKQILEKHKIPHREGTLRVQRVLGIDAHVWKKAVNTLIEELVEIRFQSYQMQAKLERCLEREVIRS